MRTKHSPPQTSPVPIGSLSHSQSADSSPAPDSKVSELPGDTCNKKQLKKQKRPINITAHRNVKKKTVKSPKSKKADGNKSVDYDPNLSQILGGSLNDMLASETPMPHSTSNDSLIGDSPSVPNPREASSPAGGETQQAAPVRRRGTTRLTAVKQQLSEVLEENHRLKNAIGLLESDIDTINKNLTKIRKCDVAQKSEIKKLT